MDREKFKEMSWKSKIQWLLQYYGIKTVVALIAVFTVVYFLKSVFFPAPIPDVSVLMLTDTVTNEMATSYAEGIEALTGNSAEVIVYAEHDPYGKQAFATKVGTDVTDLVVAPKEETELLVKNHFLLSYAPLEGTELYIGISRSAREGDLLLKATEYLTTELENNK